jgi:hypothetical protein
MFPKNERPNPEASRPVAYNDFGTYLHHKRAKLDAQFGGQFRNASATTGIAITEKIHLPCTLHKADVGLSTTAALLAHQKASGRGLQRKNFKLFCLQQPQDMLAWGHPQPRLCHPR